MSATAPTPNTQPAPPEDEQESQRRFAAASAIANAFNTNRLNAAAKKFEQADHKAALHADLGHAALTGQTRISEELTSVRMDEFLEWYSAGTLQPRNAAVTRDVRRPRSDIGPGAAKKRDGMRNHLQETGNAVAHGEFIATQTINGQPAMPRNSAERRMDKKIQKRTEKKNTADIYAFQKKVIHEGLAAATADPFNIGTPDLHLRARSAQLTRQRRADAAPIPSAELVRRTRERLVGSDALPGTTRLGKRVGVFNAKQQRRKGQITASETSIIINEVRATAPKRGAKAYRAVSSDQRKSGKKLRNSVEQPFVGSSQDRKQAKILKKVIERTEKYYDKNTQPPKKALTRNVLEFIESNTPQTGAQLTIGELRANSVIGNEGQATQLQHDKLELKQRVASAQKTANYLVNKRQAAEARKPKGLDVDKLADRKLRNLSDAQKETLLDADHYIEQKLAPLAPADYLENRKRLYRDFLGADLYSGDETHDVTFAMIKELKKQERAAIAEATKKNNRVAPPARRHQAESSMYRAARDSRLEYSTEFAIALTMFAGPKVRQEFATQTTISEEDFTAMMFATMNDADRKDKYEADKMRLKSGDIYAHLQSLGIITLVPLPNSAGQIVPQVRINNDRLWNTAERLKLVDAAS